MDQTKPLILASTSPRRREILESLGVRFDVESVTVDESAMPGETPLELVLRLAVAKAAAATTDGLILGSDTVVVVDGQVLGKPRGQSDAMAMLSALSGRRHEVLTGVALRTPRATDAVLSRTEVKFREINQDEARAYWQSGEPADKAGSYGIQGLGGVFVESIRGSYSGVMGLPVFETAGLLRQAGINVLTKKQ